jgi:DNA invertase Pin-like site-specific DNA recombinase
LESEYSIAIFGNATEPVKRRRLREDLFRKIYRNEKGLAIISKPAEELDEGDTMVVTKLDRFARSTVDAIQTVRTLFDKGVRVHILNMGVVEDTVTGRLNFNIMSSFAEFERDMIAEWTQEGKMIAKQPPDFREGRPRKHTKQQVLHALKLLETHTYKQVEKITGIQKRTLIRRKKETFK